MNVNGIEIRGKSVSGYATSVALPEYNLCFDVGTATHAAIQAEHMAITHGHLDHFGGVARHGYTRGMTGMPIPKYIVPPHLSGATHQMFQFWADVQCARIAPYEVVEAPIGAEIPIGKGRFLVAFPTVHRVKSQGYVLFERRKRLKEEFRGVAGAELGRMRREGIVFEDEFELPLFALTGDTEARVLDTMPEEALKASVLAFECSFLNDVPEAEAVRKGHTHIAQLAQRESRFENVGSVMLYHFSQRYTNRDIEAAIAGLPESLRHKTTYLPM